MAAPPTYDLVLYGATGFTGRLVARYLDGVPEAAAQGKPPLRWAVAGRSERKLRALKASGWIGRGVPSLAVELTDARATDRLVRSARAVINCAGPFSQCHGEALLGACAREGVHYADLAGESWWQAEMIEKYHDVARRSGAKVILGGGVDSVPSDLGAMLALGALGATGTDPAKAEAKVRVVATYTAYTGSMSGGTVASGRARKHARRAGHPHLAAARDEDPYLLCDDCDVAAAGADVEVGTPDGMPAGFSWGFRWRQPFFMGGINARVVRRSLALRGLAARVSYAECSSLGLWLRLAWTLLTSGMGYLRGAPIPLKPVPGQGPPAWLIREGSFAVDVVATAETAASAGGDGATAVATIRGVGDPGYGATAKMLGEVGLCLALDPHQTWRPEGGVLTPSTGLGDLLVRRLRAVDGGKFMSLHVTP